MTRTSTRPSKRHRLGRIADRLLFVAATMLIVLCAYALFLFCAVRGGYPAPDMVAGFGALLVVAASLMLAVPPLLARTTSQDVDETRSVRPRAIEGTIISGPAGVELTPTGIQFLLEDPHGTYLVTYEPATARAWLAQRLGQPGTRVRVNTHDTPARIVAAPIKAETVDLLP